MAVGKAAGGGQVVVVCEGNWERREVAVAVVVACEVGGGV